MKWIFSQVILVPVVILRLDGCEKGILVAGCDVVGNSGGFSAFVLFLLLISE
jgi:hypothetical protein